MGNDNKRLDQCLYLFKVAENNILNCTCVNFSKILSNIKLPFWTLNQWKVYLRVGWIWKVSMITILDFEMAKKNYYSKRIN